MHVIIIVLQYTWTGLSGAPELNLQIIYIEPFLDSIYIYCESVAIEDHAAIRAGST